MAGITETSYGLNHEPAFVGQVADSQLTNIVGKLNATNATIPFGKGVVASGEGIALPAAGAAAGAFVGVTVRELNRAYGVSDSLGAVAAKDASVLTAGVIWVKAAEAVVARDPAFLRVGATANGDFAKSAGTGPTESVAIAGAKFLTGGAAGALVKVSFVVGG